MNEGERAWLLAGVVVVVGGLLVAIVVGSWRATTTPDDGVIRHNWETDEAELAETQDHLESLDLGLDDLGHRAHRVTPHVLGCAAVGDDVAQPELLTSWQTPEAGADDALAALVDHLEEDRWKATGTDRGTTTLERDLGTWTAVATITSAPFVDEHGASQRSIVVSAAVDGAQPCIPD